MLQFETDKKFLNFHGQNRATLNHDQKLLSFFLFPFFIRPLKFLWYRWISWLKALTWGQFFTLPVHTNLVGWARVKQYPGCYLHPFERGLLMAILSPGIFVIFRNYSIHFGILTMVPT
jgi:hypothetical protein